MTHMPPLGNCYSLIQAMQPQAKLAKCSRSRGARTPTYRSRVRGDEGQSTRCQEHHSFLYIHDVNTSLHTCPTAHTSTPPQDCWHTPTSSTTDNSTLTAEVSVRPGEALTTRHTQQQDEHKIITCVSSPALSTYTVKYRCGRSSCCDGPHACGAG